MRASPRFAFPTRLFEGTLRAKVERAAALRVSGLQLDLRHEVHPGELSETGRRHFRQVLGEHGMTLAGGVFPLRRSLSDEQGLEERVAGTVAAIRFAAELKLDSLILRPGPLPPADGPGRPLLVEVLNDLARAAEHVGVTVALTNGREQPEDFAALLAAVSAGFLGVNLDPAALVMAGLDPAAAARVLHDRLRHVRLRDGQTDADGAGTEVPVGRGEVEWQELFATLVEAEFDGWLTPDRTAGEDPVGDAVRAVSRLRDLLPF